jgi:hypothetical protein
MLYTAMQGTTTVSLPPTKFATARFCLAKSCYCQLSTVNLAAAKLYCTTGRSTVQCSTVKHIKLAILLWGFFCHYESFI